MPLKCCKRIPWMDMPPPCNEEQLNCMESLEAAMAVASGAAQDPSSRLVYKIIDGS